MPHKPPLDDRARLEQALDIVFETPPADRAARIEALCGNDLEWRAELEHLVAACQRGLPLLDQPAVERFAALFGEDDVRAPGLPPDRYEIVRELGRGGMAVVYLARDLRHNRDVAIKVLHPRVGAAVGRERFSREIQVVARLTHPHVVPLLDSGETSGDSGPRQLWYAMPYLQGESLRDRLKREGQLPVPHALRIATEVADALDYAHRQGFIHRDIKPANILLQEGHALVADFGIARAIGPDNDGELTGIGMLIGTPRYMSPEQAMGGPLDARTDIFSLGCVLHEMLSGRPPVEATTSAVDANVSRGAPPTSGMPPAAAMLEPVLARAMARVPSERYATAREFAVAMAQAVDNATRGASSPTDPAAVRAVDTSAGSGKATAAQRLRRALPYAAVAVLALAIPVAFANLAPASDEGIPSIAVLPLTNLGPEAGDSTFADAITEELISVLGREPQQLRVISSTSSFLFRDRRADVRAIAESLGVSYLLEGSIQRVATNLRLQLRLVHGEDRSVRWRETYQHTTQDVLGVREGVARAQEDVARAVALALGVGLRDFSGTGRIANASASSTADRRFDAMRLYWAGSDMRLMRSEGGARQALTYFEQALAADSTFAPAHAAMARFLASGEPRTGLSVRERFARAEFHARRALALDSMLAEAHQGLAAVFLHQYQLTAAEARFRRALELDPTNSFVREVLTDLFIFMGRFQEALDEARLATLHDPRRPSAHAELARAWLVMGRCDSSSAALRRAEQLSGDTPMRRVPLIAAQCLGLEGRWAEAIAAVRPLAEGGGIQALSLMGLLLAKSGATNDALRVRDSLFALDARGQGSAFHVARVSAGLGQYDDAFAWLGKAIDDRSLNGHVMDPLLAGLQRDPRFRELQARLGIVAR